MRRTHGSEGAGARQRAPATRLGDQLLRGGEPDRGDRVELVDLVRERRASVGDPGVEAGDLAAEAIDVGQHRVQDRGVVVGEEPAQRLLQRGGLGPQPAPGHRREDLRVPLAGDQGVHHRPTGHPEQVADHRGQLDLGVFEQLLHPLHLAPTVADQRTPVARQVP
jgi:hypothetical protein